MTRPHHSDRRRQHHSQHLSRSVVSAVPLAGLMVAGLMVGGGVAAAAAPPAHSVATRAATNSYQWPELHGDPSLSGVSGDPAVSASSAPSLGVNWMLNTGDQDLSSPVSGYDAALGETLVYEATNAGYVEAINEATGSIVWSTALHSSVRSTPLVYQGAVWVGTTSSRRFYRLDESTGAIDCSIPVTFAIDSAPVGGVPSGGSPTVYVGVNDSPTTSGALYAVNAADCTQDFASTPFPSGTIAGEWDPIAFATLSTGESVIVWGTADPDTAVYAVDAVTGHLIWRFAAANPDGYVDVGSGAAISPPGVNGFADGVAYIPNKDGELYALDLATGLPYWTLDFGTVVKSPAGAGTSSTPSLVGNQLLLNTSQGLLDVNAVTDATNWYSPQRGVPVYGSPIVTGPAGGQVVTYGDLSGAIRTVRLSDGAPVFTYQTHGYVAASPADVNGHILAASTDGFLYDFAVGGGSGAAPVTAITSPTTQTSVPNPNGSVVISGTATGPPIAAVAVAIQENGANGSWWNGQSGQWQSGYTLTPASLGTASGSSTPWSYALPVPLSGASLQVFATATSATGIADTSSNASGTTPSRSSFIVVTSPAAPQQLQASPYWAAPGGAVQLSGTGYRAGETVVVSLYGATLATATATHQGTVGPMTVKMPSNTTFGPAALVATGKAAKDTALALIYLSDSAAQARGGATRTAFEADDFSLGREVSASKTAFLGQVWAATSAAATESSASVTQGRVYVGDSAGNVTVEDVRDGSAVWSTAVGGQVLAAPAVDPGSQTVVVSNGTTTVTALNSASGQRRWTYIATAPVSTAVAIAGGSVFVTAADGSVDALAESTGALLWATTVSTSALSSPAVDAASSLVVVSDGSGTVTSLTTGTGAIVWTFRTGAPTTAQLALSGGAVYVVAGSSTFAVSETSGADIWKWSSPAALSATVVASPSAIVVADDTGTVTWLAPTNGGVSYQIPVGAGVTGLYEAAGFVVATTAADAYGLKTGSGNVSWSYQSPKGISAAPVTNNGIVFISGRDATLRAFMVQGQLPA